MYDVEYTPPAIQDLKYFPKHEQKEILENIDIQLSYEPTVETRNRKPMRPNSLAEWELRIGKFRVLYNVVEKVTIVEIQRIGEKQRNNFFFGGQKEEL
ncbi:type II toxin-antitoxin system RelE family toxin [Coleofasciculus chthonoplastes]|uniref:type II toxin-antitoxin system RelE family toxin n=1 Tax=Coleofasciculus chthonoplastes TaxID=64178 RepID=UPI0032FC9B77